MVEIYEYSGCGTCKKALKYLDGKNVEYKKIPIREKPPGKGQIKKMIKAYDGEIKKLFNTSGLDYRKMGLKDKIADMTEKEAIELLAGNGNLIKRPFVVNGETMLVGFKEDQWAQVFS